MSEEEPSLSAFMQSLKIMPKPNPAKTYRDEQLPIKLNPFARRSNKSHQSQLSIFGPSCACKKKRNPRKNSLKRPMLKNSLFREPRIYYETCTHIPSSNLKKMCKNILSKNDTTSANCTDGVNNQTSKLFGDNMSQQDFKSIIAGCADLRLSCDNDSELQSFSSENFRDSRSSQQKSENNNKPAPNMNSSSSCSQQAMARLSINPPCDITIDELACYFETFVHIPKKMSSMAEMMYI